MSVLKGTIAELQELYKQKQISVKEVAEQTLQQIKAVEPSIQAFLTVTEEQALQQAMLKDGQDVAG
ncbi:MAG TPA: Asp-tRNA(Asn)/Glu-tRNA(Gln) amidotransferase subunit GatA, partial [Savagea sp.]